jgi:CDP-diacylglycerol--glycerol-3-phosphate 3-phosphatidyltransferase
VIVAGTYIYLLTVPETGVYPWMVTTIVVRELLIQGLRSHLEGQGHPFGAKTAGKLKTLFQCLAIIAVLSILSFHPSPRPTWVLVRDLLNWTAVGLTVYSGLAYVAVAMPALRGKG